MSPRRWSGVARCGALCVLSVACGDESPSDLPLPDGGTEPSCNPGEERLDDGSCLEPGRQRNGCPAGEAPVTAGCQPAGIPADACGVGFVSDGLGGCEALLPATPCGPGSFALPGEDSCRDVSACGSGPWGDDPSPPGTQHVDWSYAGSDSDGSADRPWTTIQDAVNAAAPGASIRVAAGSYAEQVNIAGKAVSLLGRCPSMVEIAAPAGADAAVVLGAGCAGTEVGRIALSGEAAGVQITAVADVTLDRLWIHDTAGQGVQLRGSGASALLTDSLIELATDRGAYVEGGALTVARCAVRDIRSTGYVDSGRGINVREDRTTNGRGSLTLRESLIERCSNVGVLLHDSDGVVQSTLIRDIAPSQQEQLFGRGVQVQSWLSQGHEAATLDIRQSVIEHVHDGGLVISYADVMAEHLVVRDVAPAADSATRGYGIMVQPDGVGAPASLELSASLVERCHEMGIFVAIARADIESTIVGDTLPLPDGSAGRGIGVQADRLTGQPAELTLRYGRVAGSHEAGVFVDGSVATIEGSVVTDTAVRQSDGLHGRGISLQTNPVTFDGSALTLRESAVVRSHDVGVYLQSSAAIVQNTAIEESEPNDGGYGGIGVVFEPHPMAAVAALTLQSCSVRRSHAFGVLVFASPATISNAAIEEVSPQPLKNAYGDGVAIAAYPWPAEVHIHDSLVRSCERAGLVSFGAPAGLGATVFRCNTIDLAAQEYSGHTPLLEDYGANRCECNGDAYDCQLVPSQLEPPESPGGVGD